MSIKGWKQDIGNKMMRKKTLKKLGSEIPDNYGTCWQCFMDITKKDIDDWRDEYSEIRVHPKICPLCGYEHWKGRVWYPFKFISDLEIGNPSRRDGRDPNRVDKALVVQRPMVKP